MKTTFFILCFIASSWTMLVQTQTSEKVDSTNSVICEHTSQEGQQPLYIIDGKPNSNPEDFLAKTNPDDIISIDLVKDEEATILYGTSGKNGVVIIQTKSNMQSEIKCIEKSFPFVVHCITNDNWIIPQDVFNSLQAKVPSLNVSNTASPNLTPLFRLRGNSSPIILLDGIQVDASILNTLNPNDIESIHVAPSAAGANYFRNGFRMN